MVSKVKVMLDVCCYVATQHTDTVNLCSTHQVQTQQTETLRCSSFTAVHVVTKSQDDLL